MAKRRVIKQDQPASKAKKSAQPKGPNPKPKPKKAAAKKTKKPAKAEAKKPIKQQVSKKNTLSAGPKKSKSSSKSRVQKKSNESGASIVPIVLCILILVGFLAFIFLNDQAPAQNVETSYDPKELQQFPDLMVKIEELDKEYFTDWHEERLGSDMINPQFVPAYVEKLDDVERAVNASKGNETDINLAFLDARRRMVLSQGLFAKALKYGLEGVVTDQFTCSPKRIQSVREATALYNESFEVGRYAIPRLDEVLRKSQEAELLVGLNNAKPRWFVTNFGDIKHLVDSNTEFVEKICFKDEEISKSPISSDTGINITLE